MVNPTIRHSSPNRHGPSRPSAVTRGPDAGTVPGAVPGVLLTGVVVGAVAAAVVGATVVLLVVATVVLAAAIGAVLGGAEVAVVDRGGVVGREAAPGGASGTAA